MSLKPLASVITATAACAAAVIAMLAPAAASAAACANADANPNAISPQAAKSATLCLLNEQRVSHGLRPLQEHRRLDRASQQHAADMVRRNYFAHGDFVGRIRSSGYLRRARSWVVGENIAWGGSYYSTPASIVDDWMNSPPHRANILTSSFKQIGVGITSGVPVADQSDGATYVTDFGARRRRPSVS